MKVCVALALALSASPALASGMKMGFGGGSMNLFPYGLLPKFSGPFSLGGGYGLGFGRSEAAPYVRFGLTMIKFDGIEPLDPPRGAVHIDVSVHFEDDLSATLGAGYLHGIGRLLVGGGIGFATKQVDDEKYRAFVLVPEIAVPLRGRMSDTFTPALMFYARGELAASGRDTFGDRVMMGVSLVVP